MIEQYLLGLEAMLAVLIFVIAKKEKTYPNSRWRLVYITPVLVIAAFTAFCEFSIFFITAYIAVLLLSFALFYEDIKSKRILASCAFLLFVGTMINIGTNPDYAKEDFSGDFEKGFTEMKARYVLTEEKGIDWDTLYEKYMPKFREVDKTQDFTENYKLWAQFTGEFHDGHVGYQMRDDVRTERALLETYGNDFGLSFIKLETGEYVAINVEGYENSYSISGEDKMFDLREEYMADDAKNVRLTLKNAGIKNGTVIKAVNGQSIEALYADIPCFCQEFPVKENEEFFLPVYAAGINADSIEITFLDENSEEKTVTAPRLGAYAGRLFNTIEKIDEGVNISNLDWKEIDDQTVLLRLSSMAYDLESYDGTDYTEMTEEIRKKLLDYKDKGVKNIIFDLRRNSGGSPFMVTGVTKLFAPLGEHTYCYSAKINEKTACFDREADGKYTIDQPFSYTGEDLFHDGNIILLVNAETVSAGDDMTNMMSEYPNVKVVGFTTSNNSCQAVSSASLSIGSLSFSAVPNLDANREVIIDTRADRKETISLDERIPVTKEAVEAIFTKGEDYVLDYVMGEMK
ncbi:MAG: hypothetical protein IKQ71_07395 [Lachnospiraceae bacterium]|nr:hypothetical protein [Lachnospiraceae bacterium]